MSEPRPAKKRGLRPVRSPRQTALWCRCGSPKLAWRGLCAACYARDQHDRRCYAGHRSAVISRDGRFCRVCALPCLGPASLIVHHRKPGISRLPWLLCLCRACHARVHRLRVVRRAVYPEAFLALWREQHPQSPEQLALAFDQGPSRPQPRPLFEGYDG